MLFSRLQWKNQMTTEDEIRIYKDTEPLIIGALPSPLIVLPPGTTQYYDHDVENGLKYYYLVSSIKGGFEKYSQVLTYEPSFLDLGPGPQTLVGHNDTAGFFGEVTTTQLINGNDLASMIGLSDGTVQNPTAPWLKFFIDDKIYYVAKQPYRHTISWDQINAAGAIDGSKIIEINGYRFEVGLLEGIGSDHSIVSTGHDVALSHGSEWNRLMYNIAAPDGYERGSQVGDNWANYDQAGVVGGLWLSSGYGRYSWCKEVWPDNASRRVYRGNGSVAYLHNLTSSIASSSYGWRPRLNLVTQ